MPVTLIAEAVFARSKIIEHIFPISRAFLLQVFVQSPRRASSSQWHSEGTGQEQQQNHKQQQMGFRREDPESSLRIEDRVICSSMPCNRILNKYFLLNNYFQGFMLLREAADNFKWKLNYGGIALMWRGGCIIR